MRYLKTIVGVAFLTTCVVEGTHLRHRSLVLFVESEKEEGLEQEQEFMNDWDDATNSIIGNIQRIESDERALCSNDIQGSPPPWAKCISELGDLRKTASPGIYERPATCFVTKIFYYYDSKANTWHWTPYSLSKNSWIPVDTLRVPSGFYAGQKPAPQNIRIVKYLNQYNPDPIKSSCNTHDESPSKSIIKKDEELESNNRKDVSEDSTNLQQLIDDLQGIQRSSMACSNHFDDTKKFLEDNIIDNLNKVSKLLSSTKNLQKITSQLIANYKKVLRLARMIPTWGKVSKPAIRLVRWIDKVASRITQRLQRFHQKLKITIRLLKKIASELEEQVAVLEKSKSIASKSVSAIKSANQCVLATNNQLDDQLLESFAGTYPVVPTIGDIHGLLKACDILGKAIRESIPDLNFIDDLLAFIADVATPLAEQVVKMVNEVIDIVTSQATENICCGIVPPHANVILNSLSNVVDLATCFADPLVRKGKAFVFSTISGIEFGLLEETKLFDIEVPKIVFEGVELDPTNECALISLANSFALESYSITIPELSFDLQEILDTPDSEDDDMTFEEMMEESCSDAIIALEEDFAWDAKSLGEADCCCIVRDVIVNPGIACVKPSWWTAWPGMYESVTGPAGLFRCTCCEDGKFNDEGCFGDTAICGSQPPKPKSVGDSCPSSGEDCHCGPGLKCGRRTGADEHKDDYVCCKEVYGASVDICEGILKEGESCPSTNDNDCEGDLKCGRRTGASEHEDDYVCCKEVYGFTKDICKGTLKHGESCPSTKDKDCEGDLKCGRRSGASQHKNDYICCRDVYGFLEDICKDFNDPCDGYCMNGGVCSLEGDNAICKCSSGYSGSQCKTSTVEEFDPSCLSSSNPTRTKLETGESDSFFGTFVAVSKDIVVVGAEDESVNGNRDAGAIYVYIKDGDDWEQQAKLIASDVSEHASFGASVAINRAGDTIIVGAPFWDASKPGAVYVFHRTGSSWRQVAKLTGDSSSENYLGNAVAIDGDTIVVGSEEHGSNEEGAAYVFTYNGSKWIRSAKLRKSFGAAVDIQGDRIVIGDYYDNKKASLAGAVHVYSRSGSVWTKEATLYASDAAEWFGYTVALNGDTVVVAAEGGDNVKGENAGAVYVFDRQSSGSWKQTGKLVPSDGENDDWFGVLIALQKDVLVVGSEKENAYIFARSGGTWTEMKKLADPSGSEQFGAAVALDGTTVVVGDHAANSGTGRATIFEFC